MKSYIKIITTLSLLSMMLSACGGSKKPSESSESPVDSSTLISESESETSSESESSTTSSVEETYTVVWKNYDGTVLETDTDVVKGSTPSYDGATPLRADDAEYEYTFASWTPALSPVMSNQEYTATYNRAKIQYTISFDLGGGTSATYDGQSKKVGEFTKDIFFFDLVKEGWNFRGWSYNNVKIFDEKGNQLANPVMAKQMTFVALFSQTVKLEIKTNLAGAGLITGEGEYPYNTNVDLAVDTNESYTFVGWYVNNTLLSTSEHYNFKMWSDDVVMEARFAKETYTLSIESNNEAKGLVRVETEGAVYSKKSEQDLPHNEQVTITAYSLDSTRFLGWFDEDNQLVNTNAVYSFVMPNKDYKLIALWDCFKIDYVLNGGKNNVSNPTTYTLEDANIHLENPTKNLNTFLGWGVIIDGEYYAGNFNNLDTSIMENVTFVAKWRCESNLLKLTSNDDSKGNANILDGHGYADEDMEVIATPADDCIFVGWFNGDQLVGTTATYSFQMGDTEKSLTAHFVSKKEVGAELVKIDSRHMQYGFYPTEKITNELEKENLDVKATLVPALYEAVGFYFYYKGSFYQKYSDEWYKCSPLTWVKCGDEGYYIAEQVIYASRFAEKQDAYTYGGHTIYSNNYWNSMDSTLRIISENVFKPATDKVKTFTLNNGVSEHHGDNEFTRNVIDAENARLFLPSYRELLLADYGFTGSKGALKRQCTATDYALAQGENFANGMYYWTRSPGNSQYKVNAVNMLDGSIVENTFDCDVKLGLRPALYFIN